MGEKIKDPGFGTYSNKHARRMVNSDGSFNIKRVNKPRRLLETYHYLINVSWFKLFLLAALAFLIVNILFAVIYLIIGVEQIAKPSGDALQDFFNAFFFSSQTLTTLGYGAMAPKGIASGVVSSFEAFLGLSMFSFLTGLIYGRFSKPKASIRFSENIVLRDFDHTKAIMFRLVNNRSTVMINPKVTVTLSFTKLNNIGEYVRSFYALELERDTITYLPTTWTVVHEINEDSPLYQLTDKDLVKGNGELLVMISYFDESFDQEVYQMHSYMLSELKIDYKFSQAYYYNKEGEMVLDYDLFDKIERITM
ncbi:ion channel [Pontimicrobium sp. MEBiC06410]